jgi:anti-sigma factor RsiW
MRSIDDLTMYVCGFLDETEEHRLRDHTDCCKVCTDLIARLRAERCFLGRALAREIPATRARDGSAAKRR